MALASYCPIHILLTLIKTLTLYLKFLVNGLNKTYFP